MGQTLSRKGALGLSKSELDKRCKPSGLYPASSVAWEDKAIRKLIADGKLAARCKGSDTRDKNTDHECPICFMHYTDVNITKCCKSSICTECYLQIRPQRAPVCTCPFCNYDKFTITVAQSLTEKEVKNRDFEEQSTIEALIRAQQNSSVSLAIPLSSPPQSGDSSTYSSRSASPSMNAESPSNASNNSSGSYGESMMYFNNNRSRDNSVDYEVSSVGSPVNARSSVQVVSVDERSTLEEEMRRQMETTMRNSVQDSRGNDRGSSSRGSNHPRRGSRNNRDWASILEALGGRDGEGGEGSLNDLAVIEAAIMLSLEDAGRNSNSNSNGGGNGNGSQQQRS
jgi:hypothetical protein